MDDASLAATRRGLHAVAELVLAGPQHHSHGTIRLRVSTGGFATVAGTDLRVDGTYLVTPDQRLDMAGRSCTDLASACGLTTHTLSDVYGDATDVGPDEILELDPTVAAWLAQCWTAGDAALRRLVPTEEPVLWPEHFDVGVRIDDTNFGVSPGDDSIPEPYAYVGPPTPRHGPFWNQPFGAARPMHHLDHARPDTVLAFFTEARHRIATGE